ncbi:MAG: hypothetical protein NC411_05605 [Bacteroides sp.]|nr:hypothetical protein [Bacteroides sp.]
MQNLTRRQWLTRVGGAVLLPSFMSSCRPGISRDVSLIGSRLAEAYKPLEQNGCVACDNCMPCPYGIDIPSNLIFVDRAKDDGYLPGEIDSVDFAEKGQRFLSLYEDSIENRKQTQCCINCGECLGTCPVKIDIPQQMTMITALTDILRDLRCKQM